MSDPDADPARPIAGYDRTDPDPRLALMLDRSLPFAPEAKAALIRDQASRSRQFLLPIVRPLARAMIVVAQLVHLLSPRWPHAPRLLHKAIAFGMRHFLTPDANRLILRHFHLGGQVLRFIADNATPGFRPALEPMTPRAIADVEDELFLKHDRNVYNFLIQLNLELERRGTAPRSTGSRRSISRRSRPSSTSKRCPMAASTSSTCRRRSKSIRPLMRCCSATAISGARPIRCSSTRRSASMPPG